MSALQKPHPDQGDAPAAVRAVTIPALTAEVGRIAQDKIGRIQRITA